MAFSKLKLA
jgi:hypothetical protein